MASALSSNMLLSCCMFIAALLFLLSSSLVLANESPPFPVSATAASPAARTRKVLLVAVKGSNDKRLAAFGNGAKAGDQEELRSVPAGPDPLHHNGGGPKKPRPSSP